MNRQAAIWTTKEGKKVRVRDMTDSHLLNTIAMLKRNAPKALAYTISAGYAALACLQGEMAIFYAEQELDRLEDRDPLDMLEQEPIYQALCKEAERRKLNYDAT